MRIRSWKRTLLRIALTGFAAAMPLANTGCVGALAQFLYMVNGGHKLPAKYEGLEGQKVAMIVRSLDTVAGAAPECDHLGDRLKLILKREVDEIEFIPQDQVDEWIERRDGTQEYAEVGKAVGADKVLVVEMGSYVLNEDPTLFKGSADIEVIVFDVKEMDEVFRQEMIDFEYPKNGGQHVSETTLHRFELKFCMYTAGEIAKNFYAYNIEEDFGSEATVLWD